MFLRNLRDLSFDSWTPPHNVFPSPLLCFPMEAVLNSNNYAEPLLPGRQKKKKKKDGIEKKKTKRRKYQKTRKREDADSCILKDRFYLSSTIFFSFASSPDPTYNVSTSPSLHAPPIIEPHTHQDLDYLPTHPVSDPTFANNRSFMSLGFWKWRAIFKFLLKPFFIKKDLVLVSFFFFFREILLSFQLPRQQLVAEAVIVGGGNPRFELK